MGRGEPVTGRRGAQRAGGQRSGARRGGSAPEGQGEEMGMGAAMRGWGGSGVGMGVSGVRASVQISMVK